MKKIVLVLGVLSLISCSTMKNYTAEEVQKESDRINEFFEKSFQATLDREPQFETYVGGKKNYGQLDDLSDEAALRDLEIAKKELVELRGFDYEALDDQAKVSYRIFEYLAERKIRDFKYRFHGYPLNQMFGAQAELPSFMMNMHQVETEEDARAYISRLNEFTRYFSQLIENMKERERRGIIPPQFVFSKVLDDIKNVTTGAPFTRTAKKSALWEDFEKKVGGLKKVSRKEKGQLLEDGKKALLQSVKPAFAQVAEYMTELQKKAPVEGGASRLPDGKSFYESQLAFHTSTDLSADKIHNIGLSEVARIHGEMREIMKKVGFQGELKDFFKFMQTSKKFQYANSKAGKTKYLSRSKKIIDDMKARLDELFHIKPKADLVVKAVEPYREKSAGTAFYEGPSEDGKRSGIYYVNLSNMEVANTYEMEALAYHEGIPGHHMQVAISTELQGVPRFRKYAWMTAYGEGWGLYSEMIPKEIGFYQDPYSDFGRLSMELWRAVRLVVDTGLHSKGWTRQQGIDYIITNTPTPEAGAVRAVERYLVMPGQATAYKVGMLKILELRKIAHEKLGKKFDIRLFHDEILKNGAMPLSMLEENIDSWVARMATQSL